MDVPSTPSSPKYADYLKSRPPECENRAIDLVSRLARRFGVRVHIVHLSSAGARLEGVSAETCPHYLTFDAEEIPDGATQFKCAPPIRESANRERLWQGLADGALSMIVSDHSPCVPRLKPPGDFGKAWGGISSLQFSLPAVWTEASARGYTVERLAQWMCRAPAKLAGLGGRKGAIAAGYDADLVVWNPEATFTVQPSKVLHRHAVTPYAGRTLKGVVERTILRGREIDELHRTGRSCF
jgi:allantoinase